MQKVRKNTDMTESTSCAAYEPIKALKTKAAENAGSAFISAVI